METIKEASNKFFIIAKNYPIQKEEGSLSPELENSLKSVLASLQENRERLTKERVSIFYPKQAAPNLEMNKQGFEEEKAATEFLAAPQSSRSIIEKLINSLELNKKDFASVIFGKLLQQVPKTEAEWYNLDRTNPDKVNLYRVIQGQYKIFCDRYGVNNIDRDLSLIAELEFRTKELKDKIHKDLKALKIKEEA